VGLDGWDDLRVLLAAVRAGSVTEAARRLGLDQTTVTRRLRSFESRMGQRLLERVKGGVVLTPVGEAFVAAAEDMEGRVLALEREVAGTGDLRGPLRFTLPELLAHAWMPALVAFARAHPNVQLELVTTYQVMSLNRREADVALRMVQHPPEHLVGRRLSAVALAAYVHRDLADLPRTEMPWIAWDRLADPEGRDAARRQATGIGGPVVVSVTDYMTLLEALRAGAGAADIPCITGDREPSLVRVSAPRVTDNRLWLLTHADLRKSARVRALMAEIAALVEAERGALECRA